MAVTNAVSWRSEGIKYKKNEVFLDVVESVNLLVNSNGTVVRSEVMGALKMRTFLSGMPECKLGLNDKVCPQSKALKQWQPSCTYVKGVTLLVDSNESVVRSEVMCSLEIRAFLSRIHGCKLGLKTRFAISKLATLPGVCNCGQGNLNTAASDCNLTLLAQERSLSQGSATLSPRYCQGTRTETLLSS